MSQNVTFYFMSLCSIWQCCYMSIWTEWRGENFCSSLTKLFARNTPLLKVAAGRTAHYRSVLSSDCIPFHLNRIHSLQRKKKICMYWPFSLNRSLTSQTNKEQRLATADFWVKSSCWSRKTDNSMRIKDSLPLWSLNHSLYFNSE